MGKPLYEVMCRFYLKALMGFERCMKNLVAFLKRNPSVISIVSL